MLIRIHPDNPQERSVSQIVDALKNGSVIVYPTDTIYGWGCDMFNHEALERICKIKGVDFKKAQFSFICADLSHLSQFTKPLSMPVFRLLKRALPGPYTFILPANKQVPKWLKSKKDTVGIRVPNNRICQMIIKELGHPIMSLSLPETEDPLQYTDPETIQECYTKKVDYVIDAGLGGTVGSTIIDCSTDSPELIREGLGDWREFITE